MHGVSAYGDIHACALYARLCTGGTVLGCLQVKVPARFGGLELRRPKTDFEVGGTHLPPASTL